MAVTGTSGGLFGLHSGVRGTTEAYGAGGLVLLVDGMPWNEVIFSPKSLHNFFIGGDLCEDGCLTDLTGLLLGLKSLLERGEEPGAVPLRLGNEGEILLQILPARWVVLISHRKSKDRKG